MTLWFRIYDPDPQHPEFGGCHLIHPDEAQDWNNKNYGIFWAIQEFHGDRRTISELKKINCWAIDIDNFDKRTLIDNLSSRAPLPPTRIVETKSGLHVYWKAIDATPDMYTTIVEDRLGWLFEGDKKAKDLARVLRVPGFLHCKNPSDKFLIRTIYESQRAYTEEEMIHAFKLPRIHEAVVVQKQETRRSLRTEGEGFFEKLWSMDQMEALKRLSGTEAVQGENYTFKKTARGRFNIIVNGKDSGCFIGEERRIGSADGGGPTVANWLKWYGRTWKEVIRYLKAEFPELREAGDRG